MPLEFPLAPLAERITELNRRFTHHSATAVLEQALRDPHIGSVVLVSSFGADSVALLHMLSVIDRSVPVMFLDTEMLFHETLTYQAEVAQHLGLSDVRIVHPDRDQTFLHDSEAMLHGTNPDACCTLRKIAPLAAALAPFDAWVTGRKRYQSQDRAALQFFESDGPRIKINPLAHWNRNDVQDYIINNRLPRHPLVAQGFRSLGCAPCTSPVKPGENDRAGRWRGQNKAECGIHMVNGKWVRA